MYKANATTPAITKVYTDLGVKFVRPEDVGLPNGLIHTNWWGFRPREPALPTSGRPRPLVVRGGYAIFGYPMPLRDFNARMRQNPPTTDCS